MAMVRTTEKAVLDYKIVERVIEDNFVHSITVAELTGKVNELAKTKHGMLTVEVLGSIRTPAIVYEEGEFEAYIETMETDEGIGETFKLVSHTDDVGNLEFNALEIHSVEWNEWSDYFLIKLYGNDIQIMISYHE